jgi:hypothetical protein
MSEKFVSKQEVVRKRVYSFYNDNKDKGKKFTKDHFVAENIPESTIYRIIQRAENESGHKRVRGSGRKAKIMTKTNIKKLETMFDHKDGISQRQAARKFKCSHQYIGLTLATKTRIRPRKKIKIPKRSEQQLAVLRQKCSRLYQKFQNRMCVIDDESYFTLNHSNINGNDIFYTSDVNATSAAVKYQPTEKFQKKLLVWIAFSENGISQPYFVPSGLAVNQHIYLNECIKKRLMPFIENHHSDGKYLFWPDLASSHYAKTVIEYLNEKNVPFVQKSDNPANMPELRPIENFWAILKGLVYESNWQAENLDKLRERIKYCLKKVDFELIQRLSRSIPGLVDNVRRNGLIQKKLL